jgi:hypothetical protein
MSDKHVVQTYIVRVYEDGSAQLETSGSHISSDCTPMYADFEVCCIGGSISADEPGELHSLKIELHKSLEHIEVMDGWELNLDAEPVSCSDGWYYGLTNGYINLEELVLNPEQLEWAETAVVNLESLFSALQEAGLWEEM